MNIKYPIRILFGYFILVLLVTLTIVSFTFYTKHIPLYLNLLESSFFIYSTGLCFIQMNKKQVKGLHILFLNFVYILISFIIAVWLKNAHILDFFLIFKAFVYILFLTLIINKITFNKNSILIFIKFIFLCFFLKYLISLALKLNDRPTVFTENNFELMLLCVLFLIFYKINKKDSLKYLVFLGIIIFMSMSRSALLMYGTVFVYIMNKLITRHKLLIFSFSLPILFGLILVMFTSRTSDFEDIDRLKFFFIFLYEVRDWDFYQFLIGAPRITPLSTEACSAMSYWQNLHSYSGDGSCYSVILHSYLMRIIFDHGFLGLFFLLYSVYKILRLSRIQKDIIWIVLSIFIINGLSVSAFNSIFFPISLLFLIGTDYYEKNIEAI